MTIFGDADAGHDVSAVGRRWTAISIVITLAGAGLVLLSTAKYGAGISSDSAAYLDVARSLIAGRGFVYHDGTPYTWWPPLYPMLLAGVELATRLDPAAFAHVLNAVLFATVILLSASLFRRSFEQEAVYGLLGVCAVLLSAPLLEIYVTAWSESLFVPLLLLYLISAQAYREGGTTTAYLVMAVSAAFAILTRYAGLALVPTGMLTLLLAPRARFGARVRRACAFAAFSLIPLGVWLVCNQRALGSLLKGEALPEVGDTGRFSVVFIHNLGFCFVTFLKWYLPAQTTWLAASFAVITASVTATLALSNRIRGRIAGGMTVFLVRHSSIILLSAVYTVLTLSMVSAKHYLYEGRYLAPLFVPTTLLLMRFGSLAFGTTKRSNVVSRIPSVLLALWLCFPLVGVAGMTAGRLRNGAGGLNTKEWRNSETVASARQMCSTERDVHVYSNGANALWELARIDASGLPLRSEVSLNALRGRWPADSVSFLVWFDNRRWRSYFYSVDELKGVANIDELTRLSDGAVYRVSPLTAPPSK